MPPVVATVVFAVGVLVLFALDRDTNARTSKALWIPVIWVALAGSRTVSQWLGLGSPVESATQALEGNPLDRNIQAGLMAARVIPALGKGRGNGRGFGAHRADLLVFSLRAASTPLAHYPILA